VAGQWRREPLPPGWETRIRPAVLRRDHGQCQWPVRGVICGILATDVDHIDPGGPQDDPDNLWSLCGAHHKRKSSAEAGRAAGVIRRRIAAARLRPAERHPGLLDKSGG
jgi:5-methylcytosine-specific restriction endonuclease McrA